MLTKKKSWKKVLKDTFSFFGVQRAEMKKLKDKTLLIFLPPPCISIWINAVYSATLARLFFFYSLQWALHFFKPKPVCQRKAWLGSSIKRKCGTTGRHKWEPSNKIFILPPGNEAFNGVSQARPPSRRRVWSKDSRPIWHEDNMQHVRSALRHEQGCVPFRRPHVERRPGLRSVVQANTPH